MAHAFKLLQLIFVFFESGQALKQAVFQRQKAQYLPDSVIQTKYANSELECSLYCTRLEGCLSANYNVGDGLCQLNNNTVSEKDAVKDLNFVYLGISPWTLKARQNEQQQGEEIETKTSCKEWITDNPILGNGVYHLKASSEIYRVWCSMAEIPGCPGEGWTLVMKMNGEKTTFKYESPYWTNKESYAVEDGLEGLTEKESILASYWNTPFTKICLAMTVNGDMRKMMLNYQASSLYSLIADGNYRNTSAGRAAWKSLVVGSSLQNNCNEEGFGTSYQGQVRMRVGYLANNQNDCLSSDSCIGFGISYKACYKKPNITCGNIAGCGSDKGDRLTAAFGYILVH